MEGKMHTKFCLDIPMKRGNFDDLDRRITLKLISDAQNRFQWPIVSFDFASGEYVDLGWGSLIVCPRTP
jgi:hypothetical protein